jgi:hypothetical protein
VGRASRRRTPPEPDAATNRSLRRPG